MNNANRLLKDRFLEALIKGELGSVENEGIVVTLKEFKAYFMDIKRDYIHSFLPAATFEPGSSYVTHAKYLTRIKKGGIGCIRRRLILFGIVIRLKSSIGSR